MRSRRRRLGRRHRRLWHDEVVNDEITGHKDQQAAHDQGIDNREARGLDRADAAPMDIVAGAEDRTLVALGVGSGESNRRTRSTKASALLPSGRRVHCTSRTGPEPLVRSKCVDDDWEKERPVRDHQVTAVNRELPLEPKIPFVARLRWREIIGINKPQALIWRRIDASQESPATEFALVSQTWIPACRRASAMRQRSYGVLGRVAFKNTACEGSATKAPLKWKSAGSVGQFP